MFSLIIYFIIFFVRIVKMVPDPNSIQVNPNPKYNPKSELKFKVWIGTGWIFFLIRNPIGF